MNKEEKEWWFELGRSKQVPCEKKENPDTITVNQKQNHLMQPDM